MFHLIFRKKNKKIIPLTKIDQREEKNTAFLSYYPASCEIGNLENDKFLRKVRQIEEVTYEPTEKPENIRHLEVKNIINIKHHE